MIEQWSLNCMSVEMKWTYWGLVRMSLVRYAINNNIAICPWMQSKLCVLSNEVASCTLGWAWSFKFVTACFLSPSNPILYIVYRQECISPRLCPRSFIPLSARKDSHLVVFTSGYIKGVENSFYWGQTWLVVRLVLACDFEVTASTPARSTQTIGVLHLLVLVVCFSDFFLVINRKIWGHPPPSTWLSSMNYVALRSHFMIIIVFTNYSTIWDE